MLGHRLFGRRAHRHHFAQIVRELVAQILAGQTEGHRRLQEARLGAAVVALATETETRITSYNVCYTKLLR